MVLATVAQRHDTQRALRLRRSHYKAKAKPQRGDLLGKGIVKFTMLCEGTSVKPRRKRGQLLKPSWGRERKALETSIQKRLE